MSYQDRDYEVIDYRIERLSPPGWSIRGPLPPSLAKGDYFVCIGGSQTFGRFCERPWPTILSEELGLPVLNLGLAGAGPRFFMSQEWLRLIRNARFVVYQVMSGRSEGNVEFDSRGKSTLMRRSDGATLSADQAWEDLLQSDIRGVTLPLLRRVFRRVLACCGRFRVRRLVSDTRANWVLHFQELLDATSVPKALLWLSRREPDYSESYKDVWSLFGEFPELVNEQMVEAIKPRADVYAECVTERGSPQPLRSRFSGEPVSVSLGTGRDDLPDQAIGENAYYPSPEMHEDAAAALLPKLKAWLSEAKIQA